MASIAPAADTFPYIQPAQSAVSWGAIAAGAAAAAALSLILLILGTGLGLSAVSPWVQDGISATSFGISTILWLTFTQLAASALGGYLAGRLRRRWTDTDGDEIYFRDTAHGFLAWAIASLATAALLTSAIGAVVSAGAKAGTAVAGAAAAGAGAMGASKQGTMAGEAGPAAYYVDALFRREGGASPEAANSAQASEVARIFANTNRAATLPAEDVRYVGQLVAQRTGLPQADAEKRVTENYNLLEAKLRATEAAAKEAADKARKASAYAALWLFISLLAGAFVASLAATWGGRRRDARTVDIPLNS